MNKISGTILGLLLLAGASPQAHALEVIKATQAVASFSFLPADYAQDAGYFKEEGLDVQQIATKGGGPDMAALVSGNVNFNFGVGVYQINAIRAKRDLVTVLNMEQRPSISVVISKAAAAKTGVKPDAPLKERAAALKGLKIGVTRPGSLTDKEIRRLMKIGGLKEGDVKIVAIGSAKSMIAAIKLGQIDGFSISIPYDRLAVNQGLAVQWVDNPAGQDPAIDPFLMSSLVTTPTMVKEHPELVRKMVKALRHAIADIISKPIPDIIKVIKHRYSTIDEHTMEVSLAAAKKLMNPTGEVSLQMAKNTVEFDGRGVSAEALFKTIDGRFLK
jgi:NitT/TauT family transport system substrate-binding protein